MNLPRFRRRGGKVCPSTCPHCGELLPPCVTPHELEAARVLLNLPAMTGLADDVLRAGITTRRSRAAELLRLAGQAGLIEDAGWTVTPGHQRAKVWRAVPDFIRAYGTP